MKVRMRTLSAGPAGSLEPGKVYDLPDAHARDLIAGKFAESAEPPVKGQDKPKDDGKGKGDEKPKDDGKGKDKPKDEKSKDK